MHSNISQQPVRIKRILMLLSVPTLFVVGIVVAGRLEALAVSSQSLSQGEQSQLERPNRLAEEQNRRVNQFSQEAFALLEPEAQKQAVVQELINGDYFVCSQALVAMSRMDQARRLEIWSENGNQISVLLKKYPQMMMPLVQSDKQLDAPLKDLMIANISNDSTSRECAEQSLRCLANANLTWDNAEDLDALATTLNDTFMAPVAFDLLRNVGSPEALDRIRFAFRQNGLSSSVADRYLAHAAELGIEDELKVAFSKEFDEAEKMLNTVAFLKSAIKAFRNASDYPDVNAVTTAVLAGQVIEIENEDEKRKAELIAALSENYAVQLAEIASGKKERSSTSTYTVVIDGRSFEMPIITEPKHTAESIKSASESERVAIFNSIQNASSIAELNGENDPLETWCDLPARRLSQLVSIASNSESDVDLGLLFRGLNVRHERVSVAAASRLAELLPPSDFPNRFFQYLATRQEYSLSEVDRYIGFLTSHCQETPDAVATALATSLKDANGQPELMSWIKKIIAIKTLKQIGTKAQVELLEEFTKDDGSFIHETSTSENSGIVSKKSVELKFADLARDAIAAIKN